MSRIMATDDDGDRYVAEHTVGDATVRVLPGSIDKRRRDDGAAYWEQATYEVVGPDGEVGGIIIRRANGSYDVPDKAQRVGLAQAVAITLGRETAGNTVASTDSGPADLEAALAASIAAKSGQVKPEPRENWELRQGDRIMRHLALYPEGADPATMSAGMHDMPTAKIRAHLRRLMKDGGPVVELEPGRYARRGAA